MSTDVFPAPRRAPVDDRVGSRAVARALAGAAQDAGAPADLLGDLPDLLLAGRRPDEFALTRFRGIGAVAADRGVALPALIDLHLTAAWRMWPHLPEVRRAVDRRDAAAVRDLAGRLLRTSDDVVAALADGYQQARRQAARREEGRRREFVDDLLTGASDVASLTERAEQQGFRLHGVHRVLVVASDRRVDDAGPVARAVESDLAGHTDPAGLLVATKAGQLVVVVAGDAPADVAEQVARRLQALEPTRTWQVAVSRPAPGADGVRRGWAEARDTLTAAARLRIAGPVVHGDELLAFRALLVDPAMARDLVDSALGPLTAARGGAEPLVDTLLAYFDAGANTTAAARALHLSVRAVVYRLQRVTELTGLALDVPTQRFTLHTAAVAARLLDWPRSAAPAGA